MSNLLDKRCSKCLELKLVSEFSKNISSNDGFQSECKLCNKITYAAFILNKRANGLCRCGGTARLNRVSCDVCHRKQRDKRMRDDYGLSIEQVEQMYSARGWRCDVCKAQLSTTNRRLSAVDHDHDTGVIRGILCLACNTGLGNFRESKETLQRAIDYLDRHENGK